MADTIKTKVQVEGEQQFKTSLQNMNKSLSALGSEMKAVASEFAGQEKTVESLSKENEVLNKSIAQQKDKISLLQKQIEKSSEVYGENSNYVLDLKKKMYDATAEMNKQENQLKQNTKQMDELGKGTKDVKEGLKDAADSGLKFGDILKANVLSDAIVGGIKALGSAIVDAAKGIGNAVMDAAYAADDLNTMAKTTGIATDQLQKYQYAAEMVDVDVETIAKSMSKLTKNMETAKKGTGDAANAFKELGIQITDENGELRSNDDVFNEIIQKLSKMDNETQRDAYAMQLLGKSAQDLNPIIVDGGEALAEYSKQAEEMGLILSQDQLDSLNLVSDAMDTLKATVTSAGRAFVSGLAEPVAGALDLLTSYVGRLVEAFNEDGINGALEEASLIVKEMAQKITEAVPDILSAASAIMQSLLEGILSALPDVVSAASDIMLQLVSSLIDNLPMLIETALQLIMTLVNGISEALPELIPAAVETILAITEYLLDNIDVLIECAMKLMFGLAEGLIKAIPVIVTKIPTIIAKLVEALKKGIEKFRDIGKQLVNGLWQGIKDNWQTLVNNFKNAVTNMVKSVKETLGIASPSKVFANIGKFMAQGLEKGWSSVDAIGAIKDSVSNMNLTVPNSNGFAEALQSIDLSALLQNAAVYMDGTKVGKLITNWQRNAQRMVGGAIV